MPYEDICRETGLVQGWRLDPNQIRVLTYLYNALEAKDLNLAICFFQDVSNIYTQFSTLRIFEEEQIPRFRGTIGKLGWGNLRMAVLGKSYPFTIDNFPEVMQEAYKDLHKAYPSNFGSSEFERAKNKDWLQLLSKIRNYVYDVKLKLKQKEKFGKDLWSPELAINTNVVPSVEEFITWLKQFEKYGIPELQYDHILATQIPVTDYNNEFNDIIFAKAVCEYVQMFAPEKTEQIQKLHEYMTEFPPKLQEIYDIITALHNEENTKIKYSGILIHLWNNIPTILAASEFGAQAEHLFMDEVNKTGALAEKSPEEIKDLMIMARITFLLNNDSIAIHFLVTLLTSNEYHDTGVGLQIRNSTSEAKELDETALTHALKLPQSEFNDFLSDLSIVSSHTSRSKPAAS